MSTIKKLTNEQWAELPAHCQKWVDDCTQQVTLEEVGDAVSRIYGRMGKDTPTVYLAASPLSCSIVAKLLDSTLYSTLASTLASTLDSTLYSTLDSTLKSTLGSTLDSTLYSMLESTLDLTLKSTLGSTLDWTLESTLGLTLDSTLYSTLISTLDSTLDLTLESTLKSTLKSTPDSTLGLTLDSTLYSTLISTLKSTLDSTLTSTLDSMLYSTLHSTLTSTLYSTLYSTLTSTLKSTPDSTLDSTPYPVVVKYWSWWAAYYEFAKTIGVEFDPEVYDDFVKFSGCVDAIIAMDGVAIVSQKPVTISWQEIEPDGRCPTPYRPKNYRLHNESGPAIEYADGWKIWAIGNVVVDEQVVMQPQTQTLEQINNEENEEVRRIRIERYGWSRYLAEINATVIDERSSSIENTKEILCRCDDMVVLVCHCPSQGKVFALEVPPEIKTCESAQQWLHGGSETDNLFPTTRVVGRS